MTWTPLRIALSLALLTLVGVWVLLLFTMAQ
ncbi:hypothetical protein EV668_1065 [Enterovirga rhinocerotis]|uniref:Uncharacterized protein n=1 Tax=Enterovirga rhinocerotis TaxID=1339210 RepID=A0A4R7C5X2_9HYPH|nr:hypothetical protein EV668_1065 [Enterovirga rhinocerotis]